MKRKDQKDQQVGLDPWGIILAVGPPGVEAGEVGPVGFEVQTRRERTAKQSWMNIRKRIVRKEREL